MRSLYLNLVLTGFIFVIPQLSFAEEMVKSLPTMTITTQPPLDEISHFYTSQNSEIYNEKALGIAHEQNLDAVLTGERGVMVTKPGSIGTGRIYLRGVGGRGLLSLDGMPIPDSVPNTMNLGALIPDGLGEMEVTRGFSPASRTFSALGGAIRLTSRDAIDNSGDVRVEGGTYGTLKETLRTNFVTDNARLAITANRIDVFDGAWQAIPSKNNPERDPFHSTQFMLKGGVNVTKNIEWEGSMLYRNSLNKGDMGGIRSGVFQQIDDKDSYLRDEGWVAQNTLNAKISDTWISRLQLGYSGDNIVAAQGAISPGIKTDSYMARWENDQLFWQDNNNSFSMIWGAEERYESGSAPLINKTVPPTMSGKNVSEHRQQQAGFLDNRFTYGIFSSDVGVRYESYENYNNQVLLHLGTAWQLANTLKFTTNAGNGFRIPSYSELLFPGTGNLNLKPEHNVGGDLGFEWKPLANLKLNATGFYTHYSDLITLTYNTALPCRGVCLLNINEAVIAGAEAGSEITFNSTWRGGFAYTFTDTENLANHKDIPFRPSHVSRIWGEWKSADLPLTLWSEGTYQNQSQNNIDNTLPVGANFRMNIHANYKVSPELDLYVRGENLTNNTTPMMFSFYQTGATVFGGIALKLW